MTALRGQREVERWSRGCGGRNGGSNSKGHSDRKKNIEC